MGIMKAGSSFEVPAFFMVTSVAKESSATSGYNLLFHKTTFTLSFNSRLSGVTLQL